MSVCSLEQSAHVAGSDAARPDAASDGPDITFGSTYFLGTNFRLFPKSRGGGVNPDSGRGHIQSPHPHKKTKYMYTSLEKSVCEAPLSAVTPL